MTEGIQQLLQWVSAHPGWAGATVFLMSLVESLAIVGMIVPGVVILFGLGALIGAGALDFWTMCLWAVAGAILGDGFSYWLGRRYQLQLTQLWPFSRYPHTLDQGIAFFNRYGGKSVALGRFFGPIRAVIPLVAGMLSMPANRFLAANVLSALAWAPAYLLPGMAFGASLELASEIALRLVILAILLLGILWFVGWLSHRIFLLLQPHSAGILRRVLAFSAHHRYLGRIGTALADPKHPEARGLAALAGMLVLGIILLTVLLLFAGSPFETLNSAAHTALRGLATPAADRVMGAIGELGGNATLLAGLVAVWLLLRIYNKPLAASHWLGGLGSIWLLSLGIEYLLFSRPALMPLLPDPYTLRFAVSYGLFAVILSGALPVERRWLVYTTATLIVSTGAIALIYQGAGLWPVILALLLGLTWDMALGVAYRTHSHNERLESPQATTLGATIIALLLALLFGAGDQPLQPHFGPPPKAMDSTQWWTDGWQALPTQRDDVRHLRDHPFSLQYAGPPDRLMTQLQAQGWHQAQSVRGLEWLKLLSGSAPLQELPILPHSHAGRYESRLMVRDDGDSRLILRLWPSGYLLAPQGDVVWLGNISRQVQGELLGLIRYPATDSDFAAPFEQLRTDLAATTLQRRLADEGRLLLKP